MRKMLFPSVLFALCAASAFSQVESALARQLAWLQNNAANNAHYIIAIHSDQTLAAQTLPVGRSNVTITLRGSGAVRTVSLYGDGSLFTVGPGVTLILDSDLILTGNGNADYLIRVTNGGRLIMNGGELRGHETLKVVSVAAGGLFSMRGGTITAPEVQAEAAAAPAGIVAGRLPAADSTGTYRIQVGAFTVPRIAVEAFYRLRNAGLNPRYERYGRFYRVVLPWLGAGDIPSIKQTLGTIGFREVIIRQETGR
ncbi:MAG: hypothetical protein FWB99_11315 [Treponema sp.]|nr:hypothetical protein [Treponema sp.]